MALESMGKRSVRNEFENACGDNYMISSRGKNHENDLLDVEMVERESVIDTACVGNSKRYFGGLVGNKEIVGMSLLAISLYLVNGEYAQSVCTALTSIPPAIFSYRVLMSNQVTKEGYHSILFYWTLYGLMALIDQFVGTAQGYNLCKIALLSTVFFQAVRNNLSVVPRAWHFLEDPSIDMITTLISKFEENEDQTIRRGVQKTPTMTQFSEDDDLEYMLPESTAQEDFDVTTAVSFVPSPSLQMQTTQNLSPESRLATPKTNRQFETMSALTTTAGGAPDIVTVPADRITFSIDNREALIQVTNVSPLHVMFALKTNADTYLIAAPTSGVLFSGQTMTMRVGVIDKYFEDFSDPGLSIDKLAIDYTSIPASCSLKSFSSQFFQSQNRRRHAIRVFYR